MGPVVLIVIGIVALLGGSEVVVRSASRLARRLGIPSLVIGLTVVSIGTSAAELAIGIQSGLQGVGELAVGTIAGTNIVNLLLILGVSTLIYPLAIRSQTLRVDLPMMAIAAVVVMVMALDDELSGFEGILLLALAVLYTAVIIYISQRGRKRSSSSDASQGPSGGAKQGSLEALALVAGIVVIVFGAEWLVGGSVDVAQQLGVSDALIGLTVVAIGTSSPEIATTVVATIRNDRDVAIGNLIGSSVYNIALVIGATAVAAPEGVQLSQELVAIDLPVMTAVVLLCVPVFITGRRVRRLEGGLFVAAYLAYLSYLLATRL